MLRYSFLPSDFHPMILFLGESDAVGQFANLLQSFAENNGDIDFRSVAFLFTVDDTQILLTSNGAESGMRRVESDNNAFIWTLQPWQAEYFSEMVAELAVPNCRSGSALLECAIGEVRVKVSLGEYTEDFLTERELVGIDADKRR